VSSRLNAVKMGLISHNAAVMPAEANPLNLAALNFQVVDL
jgi:hypothetical protein